MAVQFSARRSWTWWLIATASILMVLTPQIARAEGDAANHAVEIDQTVSLTARNGRSTARVSFMVGRLPKTSIVTSVYTDPAFYRPRSILTRFDIRVSGGRVFVPLNAIADLIDLHEASLRAQGGGYVLTFTGGDGGESYDVELQFNASRVYRRILRPGGSEQWSERTEYRWVVDD